MTKTPKQRKRTLVRRGALALIGLLTLAVVARAQTRGTGDRFDRRADHRIQMLTQHLDLTDDQAAQIRAIFETQRADRPQRGERPRSREDREAIRAQWQARRAEIGRQIEAVLTPDQAEQFRAFRASRGQGGRRGGPRHGGE